MKERIKKMWRYMMRDKVDFVMFLVCIAAVVQHQIWGKDFTDAFAVLALYVFGVMHRLGVATDIIKG